MKHTFKGKYGEGIIYTTPTVEEGSITQLFSMLDNKAMENTKVRIMPDYHVGKGCMIGTTIELSKTDKRVVPNHVGVDIGCGILAVELEREPTEIELLKLDGEMSEIVPSGKFIFPTKNGKGTKQAYLRLADKVGISEEKTVNSIGTLGGGNHFIEIGTTEEGKTYLFIHSGSRGFGAKVAKYHQNAAVEHLKTKNAIDLDGMTFTEKIEQMKKENKHTEINKFVISYKEKLKSTKVREEDAYLEGELYDDYMKDLDIAQQYAVDNRKAMADSICQFMQIKGKVLCDSIHNYIEIKEDDTHIVRKGATRAEKDETVVIPLNMKDGVIIAKGKGNKEWNCSAPHGAGRVYSRSKAKENIAYEDFQKTMKGIVTSSVVESTLDEAPQAYKPKEEILEQVQETIDIVTIAKPIYNFKGI